MEISVAIPTYNRGHSISKTIYSIINQSETVNQIVIVDDGSTDNTEEVIKKLNIPNLIYKKIDNSGPAEARRIAIELCQYSWIALCDSDDLWHVDHIKYFKKTISCFPQCSVFFSNFVLSNNFENDKFSEAESKWWENVITEKSLFNDGKLCLLSNEIYKSCLVFQPIFPSALVFSRELYDKIGGIKKDLPRINAEDAHLTRRLIAYGISSCSFVPQVTIVKHDNNFSSDIVKNYEGRLSLLERLYKKKEIPEVFLTATLEEIQKSIPRVFQQLYWAKRYGDAYKFYVNYYKQTPFFNWNHRVKYFICLIKK